MSDFFERLARGVEAAQKAMGADLIAETHPFALENSSTFPVARLKRQRDGGEPVVSLDIGNSRTTFTLAEFDRFVSELDAFRTLIPAKKD